MLNKHKQIHKQPELMYYMCYYANSSQELLHKHKESHCQIKKFQVLHLQLEQQKTKAGKTTQEYLFTNTSN